MVSMCPRHLLTDEKTEGHYTWVNGEYVFTSFADMTDEKTQGHYTWVNGEYMSTSFAHRRKDRGALYLDGW